ncbi:MAG: alanine racemase [Candidatus Omnitrophica bacterium]|nr:alanine racemase [Candidatus Omnitrophota bacterium]MDD5351949.1 alanine racemase [Candidatus Omnitrophota bacterium]MDD5550775.1 alanine racemase [Candidatus Omnitrophota bacterium]
MKNKLDKLYRPTHVEINLSNIEYNFNQVKRLVGSKTKILAVLKADAYGHGAVKVAQRLQSCGVESIGVATIPEAIELRNNKINASILLLTVSFPHEFSALIKYRITPTIADIDTAILLNKKLRQLGKKLPVHIKIDTGMGRIGVWHKDSMGFIKSLSKLKNLVLEGIYTHFSSADEDDVFTNLQIASFEKLVDDLEKAGIFIPLRHAANSIAVIRHKHSYLNLVRPGLMIYGLYSDIKSKKFIKLKPVLSFKTKVTYLKDVPAGRSISYGRTFVTQKDTKIATLPVGYADGYNRLLSNRSEVLVKGRRCPVVGRICMDHTMADVSKADARTGDEVILIGRQGKLEISAEEIAHLCSTISYEVVCWISKRVPRIYVG